MSGSRNADDALEKLRKAIFQYEAGHRPQIKRLKAKYANNPLGTTPLDVDDLLEMHARVVLVKALLAALNWRMDCTPDEGLPNPVPETGVRSILTGERRFLDYLGLERNTEHSLLVVETKCPSSTLPLGLATTERSRDATDAERAAGPVAAVHNVDQPRKKANLVSLSHHRDSKVGLGVTKPQCSFSVAYKP